MKKKNILNQAQAIVCELTSIYRKLYSQPELSFKEHKM
jgi:metal-dependent amidase/aminoacylase/carboxypeptidase family protein